jgi:hypothetical protein
MSFIVLFAMLTLLVLVVVFGLTYNTRGLKVAFIASGIVFVISATLLAAMLYAMVSSM